MSLDGLLVQTLWAVRKPGLGGLGIANYKIRGNVIYVFCAMPIGKTIHVSSLFT